MKITKGTLYPDIPINAGQVQGWKDIPIKAATRLDPLVPLGPLSKEANILITSALYFGEHSNSPYAKQVNKLKGSLLTLFARRSVARRLLVAEQLLSAGHHLLIFDAYRPYEVQKSLFDFYNQKLREKYPGTSDADLESETQNYVSLPSVDPTRPSPHNTGGAIDLAIVHLDPIHEKELRRIRAHLADDSLGIAKRVGMEMQLSAIMRRHSKMLNFGTTFDHGGSASALTHYESRIANGETLSSDEEQACNNRRLLFSIMTRAGFQPYFAEWWHFNAPESQMGAAAAKNAFATFEAAKLDENNKSHENMRRDIRQEMLELQKEKSYIDHPTALQNEILATLPSTGDPRTTGDWPAEIIAPPEN